MDVLLQIDIGYANTPEADFSALQQSPVPGNRLFHLGSSLFPQKVGAKELPTDTGVGIGCLMSKLPVFRSIALMQWD